MSQGSFLGFDVQDLSFFFCGIDTLLCLSEPDLIQEDFISALSSMDSFAISASKEYSPVFKVFVSSLEGGTF